MHKVFSNANRLANKNNARKSTGPRSPAGKARSAKNSLKHGLLAQAVLVPTAQNAERQSDFDDLVADLHRELRPQDRVEEALVERIATCYWRLRRVHHFESGNIQRALDARDKRAPVVGAWHNQLQAALGDLDYERETAALLEKPLEELTDDQTRILAERVVSLAAGFKLAPDDAPPHALRDCVRKALPEILRDQEAKIEHLRASLAAAQREHAAQRDHRFQLASLPDAESLNRIVRYENMLDRQIHRALTELRRRRQVPRRGTRRNEFCETNPTDAATRKKKSGI